MMQALGLEPRKEAFATTSLPELMGWLYRECNWRTFLLSTLAYWWRVRDSNPWLRRERAMTWTACRTRHNVMCRRGLEPRTFWLKVKCSARWANDTDTSIFSIEGVALFYTVQLYCGGGWLWRRDSNPRNNGVKVRCLTAWLLHINCYYLYYIIFL